MTMTRGALAVDLAERVFSGPIAGSLTPRRLGAEVEFIPVEALTGRRCGLLGDGAVSTLPFLRRYGGRQGWREGCTSKGTPCFTLPAGGTLTFEPGGQLEYSSPACRSASSLLALLRSVVLPLRAAAAGEGIDLLAVGIDPLNPAERAPMVIHAHRYERMAEYLGRLGPSGARMMRQTAAFQVSADFDDEPWLRWRVLNAAAPYVVAIFANSPIYAGQLTGHQSARADVWRQLDPARTGIPF
ncbi:MAG TPA: glutamate-cysteine ligase family protein, partial [Gemmatimonadales bacterium]